MSQIPCKRFWEGAIGITLTPRKQRSGEMFWTFSFVRAFKRQGQDKWEYAHHYGQKHSVALGIIMSKAFQFMEQIDPAQFVAEWEAAKTDAATVPLDEASFRPASPAG